MKYNIYNRFQIYKKSSQSSHGIITGNINKKKTYTRKRYNKINNSSYILKISRSNFFLLIYFFIVNL